MSWGKKPEYLIKGAGEMRSISPSMLWREYERQIQDIDIDIETILNREIKFGMYWYELEQYYKDVNKAMAEAYNIVPIQTTDLKWRTMEKDFDTDEPYAYSMKPKNILNLILKAKDIHRDIEEKLNKQNALIAERWALFPNGKPGEKHD